MIRMMSVGRMVIGTQRFDGRLSFTGYYSRYTYDVLSLAFALLSPISYVGHSRCVEGLVGRMVVGAWGLGALPLLDFTLAINMMLAF